MRGKEFFIVENRLYFNLNRRKKIEQQTYTARITTKIEWVELSPYGNVKYLIEVDFHKFLTTKYKISRDEDGRKWLKISPEIVKKYFKEFNTRKDKINLFQNLTAPRLLVKI